jgi:hypothetical protein
MVLEILPTYLMGCKEEYNQEEYNQIIWSDLIIDPVVA